jgi:hypothetical protein
MLFTTKVFTSNLLLARQAACCHRHAAHGVIVLGRDDRGHSRAAIRLWIQSAEISHEYLCTVQCDFSFLFSFVLVVAVD